MSARWRPLPSPPPPLPPLFNWCCWGARRLPALRCVIESRCWPITGLFLGLPILLPLSLPALRCSCRWAGSRQPCASSLPSSCFLVCYSAQIGAMSHARGSLWPWSVGSGLGQLDVHATLVVFASCRRLHRLRVDSRRRATAIFARPCAAFRIELFAFLLLLRSFSKWQIEVTIDRMANLHQLYGVLRHQTGSGPDHVLRCLRIARDRWV